MTELDSHIMRLHKHTNYFVSKIELCLPFPNCTISGILAHPHTWTISTFTDSLQNQCTHTYTYTPARTHTHAHRHAHTCIKLVSSSSCLSDPPTDTTTLLVARYLLIETLVPWQLHTSTHTHTHTHYLLFLRWWYKQFLRALFQCLH